MKKNLILLVSLLLTSLSSFSQIGYPYKTIINKDTVVVLLPKQLKEINMSIVKLEACRELQDTLKYQIYLYDEELRICKETVKSLDTQISLKEQAMGISENMNKEYEKQLKKEQKRNWWLRLQRNSLTVVTSGILVMYLIKR